MAMEYDYVVVGSGAGGGTVAARLAESGAKVLLLEAGGDPVQTEPDSIASHLPEDYQVPAFHPLSTENDALRWDFFVRHYQGDGQQQRDSKFSRTHNGEQVNGVLYPRAGCLGGCTAHNAMILVYPHNSDWDYIASLTGDDSWRAANMRRIFMRLENCHYRPLFRLLSKLGFNPGKHGFKGWLTTEMALPLEALKKDKSLIKTLIESAESSFSGSKLPLVDKLVAFLRRARIAAKSLLDPNDWRAVRESSEGIRYTPLTNRHHQRVGTRERLLDIARQYPDRLHIELDALATRVLLDEHHRAVGVEYLKGAQLYQAHAQPSASAGERRLAMASKEVILAGGAFNTPQLLMLSGIGPAEELRRHGIEIKLDLPGVGRNLQDRYEVGVVHRMNFPEWEVLKGSNFSTTDPQYHEWQHHRTGVYATNGAVIAVVKQSSTKQAEPDLFMFALLSKFSGYFPGYSHDIVNHKNYLTWAVLKAHTNNCAGRVSLRSANPKQRPEINFHYFDEGSDSAGDDLQAVIEGVKSVRRMTRDLIKDAVIAEEEQPGPSVQSDAQIGQFIKDNAWGHHASCSCAIGAENDPMAVLNSRFQVRGTQGLRVVDASVFPKIPGFFIVSAVYMIAEKAAEVILADHA